MSRWLGQNIGLFLASLLLAFFFWAVAIETEDPTRQDTFGLSLPVETADLDDNMVAYGLNGARVRVELRAPESIWKTLSLDDLRAYIDLTEAGTGTLSVPVHVDVRVSPVQVLKITPPEVSLTVEEIAEKEVTVTVRIDGTAIFGYKVDEPIVVPQTVRVRGPSSWVAQVTQAQVTVDVQGQQSDVRGDYQPALLDQNEHVVSNVEVVPKVVTVNVPITQLGYVRDLAVNVALEGQPASGYRIANLVVNPQVVKVFGRVELVRAVPGYLQTQPVSLEGLTQSVTTSVALQMAEGLSLISPPRPYVTVSLTIEAIQSGLTLAVPPVIRGLAADMTATVSIESVVLILNGPLAIMEHLQVSDVRVVLDLTNLMPGDYTVIPVVKVPDAITVQNVIPEAIPVRLERLVEPILPYR
ncbi:MAG TPA: CdaR family protein [Anaerolineae bacterium]|nr:CdaR family protein [Anaerolineae bacterium]HQI85712.1 CdaR family protein [Anaerolineae bacterium]